MARRLAAAASVLSLVGALALPVPSSFAEPSQIMLGPGSALALVATPPAPGRQVNAELCTLTAIGHDNTGRLVGITAGHCSVTGKIVYPENVSELGPVGRIVKVEHDMSLPMTGDTAHPWVEDLDFAVIEFDPDKVVPSAKIRAKGHEADVTDASGRPQVGDKVCKAGRTTGLSCGTVTSAQGAEHAASLCADEGDSGAPVFKDGRIVGLVTVVMKDPQSNDCATERGTNIDAVLAAIGSGEPGAGFQAFTG
ncbi:MAG: S1 family peptidase [Segniliparus sp.]|uniref:S1 family peptidase n=1 Tax=Segniliparus sp. TaxID=2804064 RepID=UPI003F3DBDFF